MRTQNRREMALDPGTAGSPSSIPVIWTLISVLLGGVIGFFSAYIATSRTIGAQFMLQKRTFEREDQATRAIVRSLLLDLHQYVVAAAVRAEYDTKKWGRPVQRLLDYATKDEIGRALSEEQVRAVLAAAFEADLALERLRHEETFTHPFQETFPEEHPDKDLDAAEIAYVARIRAIADATLQSLDYALALMGLSEHVFASKKPTVTAIRNNFRMRLRNRPMLKEDEPS